MARGRVPSLLSMNNGGITFATAIRLSKCHHCKVVIVGGAPCGELKSHKSGFTVVKRLCIKCVTEVIAYTQTELDVIKEQLLKNHKE